MVNIFGMQINRVYRKLKEENVVSESTCKTLEELNLHTITSVNIERMVDLELLIKVDTDKYYMNLEKFTQYINKKQKQVITTVCGILIIVVALIVCL